MWTTTPTVRLSTSNPNRIVSGYSPKRRSTIGWNTSRRVSETSNVYAENERKMTGYRKRLEAIPDVAWNKDKSRGHITRHGLTYTFEIRQTDYSEKISLDYRCRTLDDFLTLSDNKLILKP